MNENPNPDWICLFGKQKCSVSLMDRKRKYPEIVFFSLYFTFSWKKHKTFGFTNGKKEFLWNVLFFYPWHWIYSGRFHVWKWQKCCFPEKFFSCVSDFWIVFSCIKLRESFSGETYFQSEFSLKKKKKQEYPKYHSGSWTETFFFFNLVSHSPEKK